jgi:hypothetical protein
MHSLWRVNDEIPPTQSLSEGQPGGSALSVAAISCRSGPTSMTAPSSPKCKIGGEEAVALSVVEVSLRLVGNPEVMLASKGVHDKTVSL